MIKGSFKDKKNIRYITGGFELYDDGSMWIVSDDNNVVLHAEDVHELAKAFLKNYEMVGLNFTDIWEIKRKKPLTNSKSVL